MSQLSTLPLETSRAGLAPAKPRRRWLWVLGGLLLSPLVLALLGVLGYFIVFFKADVPTEVLAERYGQAPSQFIELASAGSFQGGPVQVHLRDLGRRDDAAPIVLLSGTPTGLHTWGEWPQKLAATRRVIAIDLPGFGLSGAFSNEAYSSEAYARFLLALLDRLGVQRCLLVGQGFGGEVAWQSAFLAPERVSRMALIASTGYPYDPWRRPLDEQLRRFVLTRFVLGHAQARVLVQQALGDRFTHPERLRDDQVDAWAALQLHAGNRAAQAQRRKQDRNGGQAARIAQLHLPALVVWGENDRQFPAQQAYWFQRDIGGSVVKLIEDTGNLPQEEAPEATFAAVEAFIGR